MDDRYLFRAKRIDNGEWIVGSLIQTPYLGSMRSWISSEQEDKARLREISSNQAVWRAFEVRTDTICQCTGLRDKNGKLIWENDIVKKEFYTDYDNCANSEEYIGIVKITDCAWVIETIRDKCTRPIFETMSYSEDVKHFEIIGNVFDNPELLESEE